MTRHRVPPPPTLSLRELYARAIAAQSPDAMAALQARYGSDRVRAAIQRHARALQALPDFWGEPI